MNCRRVTFLFALFFGTHAQCHGSPVALNVVASDYCSIGTYGTGACQTASASFGVDVPLFPLTSLATPGSVSFPQATYTASSSYSSLNIDGPVFQTPWTAALLTKLDNIPIQLTSWTIAKSASEIYVDFVNPTASDYFFQSVSIQVSAIGTRNPINGAGYENVSYLASFEVSKFVSDGSLGAGDVHIIDDSEWMRLFLNPDSTSQALFEENIHYFLSNGGVGFIEGNDNYSGTFSAANANGVFEPSTPTLVLVASVAMAVVRRRRRTPSFCAVRVGGR